MTTEALPADLDSERTIIVCLLADRSLLPGVIQRVHAGDFTDDLHRDCFTAIVKLYRSDSYTINKLIGALEVSGHNRDVAATFVAELEADYPRSATIGHFLNRVVEASANRDGIAQTELLHRALFTNGVSREERIEQAGKVIEALRRVDRSKHRTTKDLFADWAKGVLDRERPPMIEVAEPGTALAEFPVGKGMVTMIGAPPSAGKTALVCQLVFDALAIEGQEELRALIANCEMPPSAIFDRELSRATGIGTSYIAKRTYDPDCIGRLQAGIDQLAELMKRVEFMRYPFQLERLAADAGYHEADIVVLDYLQRFAPKNSTTDQRTKVNEAMDCCRRLASEGRAVVAISAINRPQSKNGKYEISGMGLSSFRESSEIEYGADCCYLLLRPDDESSETILKCVKNRNGERRDIHLEFHGSRMQFVDKPLGREWQP